MASELAKAYVQIIPTAEGIQGSLEKLLGPEAEKVGKSAGARLSDALGGAMKAAAAGVAAASAALVKVGKDAVAAYADFEQLVGGVETLFGESADQVQSYAARAFETAGLSANQYMETVTSFSASLLQSLGGDTAEAARIGDMAITDMADNANKMGSSMESIQNAYQGFAKQNYTMLDNLKLGYGGTQAEMQRLLADATALSGVEYDISSLSDVYQAIHVIQDELGIAGTTAKEAGETISGSLAAMRAAWSNLLVGLGNSDASIGELVGHLRDSAVTAIKNILPVAEEIVSGFSRVFALAVPMIAEQFMPVVMEILPELVKSAFAFLASTIKAIVAGFPDLIEATKEIIAFIGSSVINNLDNLIPAIVDIVLQITDTLTDPSTLSALIEASIAIILALANGLLDAMPRLIDKLPVIIDNIVLTVADNLPKIIEAGWKITFAVIEGILKAVPTLLSKVPVLILTVVDGIIHNLKSVIEAGARIVTAIQEGFLGKIEDAKTWGRDLIQNFIQGIKDKLGALKNAVKGVASTIKSFIGFSEPDLGPLADFHTFAPDMMELFAKGIHDNLNVVRQAAREAALSTREGLTPTQNSTPVTGQKTGSDAQYAPAALALAIRDALDGCGVYMDGNRVGQLVTRAQRNTARANA